MWSNMLQWFLGLIRAGSVSIPGTQMMGHDDIFWNSTDKTGTI